MTSPRKAKPKAAKRLFTPTPVLRSPTAAHKALELEALVEKVDRRLEELLAESQEILRALEPRGGG